MKERAPEGKTSEKRWSSSHSQASYALLMFIVRFWLLNTCNLILNSHKYRSWHGQQQTIAAELLPSAHSVVRSFWLRTASDSCAQRCSTETFGWDFGTVLLKIWMLSPGEWLNYRLLLWSNKLQDLRTARATNRTARLKHQPSLAKNERCLNFQGFCVPNWWYQTNVIEIYRIIILKYMDISVELWWRFFWSFKWNGLLNGGSTPPRKMELLRTM